jgi:hypothetical protein
MADLAALREQLADAMSTLPDVNVSAYLPDQMHPPAVVIEPDEVDWSAGAFARGAEPWTFLVKVLLSLVNNSAAQAARDEYLGGARDIKAAIETRMPGAFVTAARRFDAYDYAGVTYLGVEFVVNVYA